MNVLLVAANLGSFMFGGAMRPCSQKRIAAKNITVGQRNRFRQRPVFSASPDTEKVGGSGLRQLQKVGGLVTQILQLANGDRGKRLRQ